MARSNGKAGSPPKRSKKHEPKGKSEAEAQDDPRGITPNGCFIHEAMKEHKSPGSWKDYVLFVGDQMLEAWGTFNIIRMDEDGKPVQGSTIALLHKRDLHVAIGPRQAAKFWSKKLRRRTNHGASAFHKGSQARGKNDKK